MIYLYIYLIKNKYYFYWQPYGLWDLQHWLHNTGLPHLKQIGITLANCDISGFGFVGVGWYEYIFCGPQKPEYSFICGNGGGGWSWEYGAVFDCSVLLYDAFNEEYERTVSSSGNGVGEPNGGSYDDCDSLLNIDLQDSDLSSEGLTSLLSSLSSSFLYNSSCSYSTTVNNLSDDLLKSQLYKIIIIIQS